MFKVQSKRCATCIYRPDSPLDLVRLEADITDEHGSLVGWRICHQSEDVCCRGFYDRHAKASAPIRVARYLGAVTFVDVDTD